MTLATASSVRGSRDYTPELGDARSPASDWMPQLALRQERTTRFVERRRVVVTGIGIIGPSGVGKDAMWRMLLAGDSAVRPVEGFDASQLPIGIAAQVPDFRPDDFMTARQARHRGRFVQLAVAASRLAVADADVPAWRLASPRAGLFVGTSAGAIGVGEQQAVSFLRRGVRGFRRTLASAISPHSAAVESAADLDIVGPIETACSDCASSMDALAAAYRQISMGLIDVAVAGGADAPLSPLMFAAFGRSGMLARGDDTPGRACRPFDRRRSGWVVAEAGVMLVLEDAERAAARGADIYGEILGAGSGRDRPTYIGETDPSGQGFLLAARQALADAACDSGDLEHVNAHAPGVPMTDLAEARALGALLGTRTAAVPVTSIKGGLGQPLGAAGAMQLASTLLTFAHGMIPPTANCDQLDPACGLDVVHGTPRWARPKRALVTSHGLGGNTTSLVVAAADSVY
jgi:3-oxoacyl-[acyl-carrier-protein] synthase II